MLVSEWLDTASKKLTKANNTAGLDSEVFLSNALKVDRSWLHAHPDYEIPHDKLKTLNDYVERRANHEPMAYILERSEFYGREFYITNGVLVPRPESETMIDLLKNYVRIKNLDNLVIIDIGSGSGALGITASLEMNPAELISIDIENKCNEVTKINAASFGQKIEIINGNLANPIINRGFEDKNIIILANLPYVPNKYEINKSAGKEPEIAIFGGEDGLDLYRIMLPELKAIKSNTLAVFTESLPFQHDSLMQIAEQSGFKTSNEEDFIIVFTL
jgi:release factor glutamine methyltransferase